MFLKKAFVLFFSFFILVPSYSATKNVFNSEEYYQILSKDYLDQLKSLKDVFINSPDIKILPQSKNSINYLKKVSAELALKNELFFLKKTSFEFYIVENRIPFHFSLPGGFIFLSSGLITKYIKTEQLLYCVLIYELIRNEKNLYNKILIIPTGEISTQRMLTLLRLNMKEKSEINRWAYYLLKRAGIEADSYLSWLQIINRNSIDFSLLLGDIRNISREESLFKAFLIENMTKINYTSKYDKSSRNFYNFINNIKR